MKPLMMGVFMKASLSANRTAFEMFWMIFETSTRVRRFSGASSTVDQARTHARSTRVSLRLACSCTSIDTYGR